MRRKGLCLLSDSNGKRFRHISTFTKCNTTLITCRSSKTYCHRISTVCTCPMSKCKRIFRLRHILNTQCHRITSCCMSLITHRNRCVSIRLRLIHAGLSAITDSYGIIIIRLRIQSHCQGSLSIRYRFFLWFWQAGFRQAYIIIHRNIAVYFIYLSHRCGIIRLSPISYMSNSSLDFGSIFTTSFTSTYGNFIIIFSH